MKEPFVVTISREIGSGGRTVGRKLAEKLGVRYSDKDLINGLRAKFNLTATSIEQLKGEKKNWLADFIHWVAPMPKAREIVDEDSKFIQEFRSDVTTNDVFKAESDILEAIAEEGSCVIAGRSGFFVLEDHPRKVDVFITASRENRVARVMRKQNLTEEQANAVIDSVDQSRENYVKRFTGSSRYDARNYDLVINMDPLTEDEAIDLIIAYIQPVING
ncbi:MAG: cytidylate kinase-like family protein [Bacteroidales bacterium]|nr:cytidylate kinase-like family protein [Bacteroidales bacterium]